MKKSVLYVCVIIIVVGVLYGITYKITKNMNLNGDIDIENRVRLVDTTHSTNKVTQEYEIKINGEKKSLNIDFNISKEDEYYTVKAILDTTFLFNYYNENEYSEDLISNNFNESNFNIIMGTDNKEYLVIRNIFYNARTGNRSTFYVFNSDFKSINGNEDFMVVSDLIGFILEKDNVYYESNSNYTCVNNCNIRSKIEDNKIYNLFYVESEGESGELEERIYTVGNDKLDYKVKNKYKVIDVIKESE